MTAVKAQFEPSDVDLQVQAVLGRADDGLTITAIANALFPAYQAGWVRERIRRLALAGLLEIDTTTRPATVRLPGRRS